MKLYVNIYAKYQNNKDNCGLDINVHSEIVPFS